MRRFGLAEPGDIVLAALDGQKGDVRNRLRPDRAIAVHHFALRQKMALKNLIDRFEIELGGQIHDREILVIEFAMRRGGVAVAADEVAKLLDMRVHMPVEVHRHEARELQEARIDAAQESPSAARAPC